MVKKTTLLPIALLILFGLSGCMYPEDRRIENQVSIEESLLVVQSAVDRFKQNSGVLPIKNSNMDTPLYEKYIIDMEKLIRSGALGRIPSNAFEQGGSYYFVIVDAETKPTVKLMDLDTIQKAGEIQSEVDRYILEQAEPPLGEHVHDGWHRIDREALPRLPALKSVYTGQIANLLIHRTGVVAIDYATDIMQLLQRENIMNPEPTVDLRTFLVQKSPFVPVVSYAYYWRDNEPRIQSGIE